MTNSEETSTLSRLKRFLLWPSGAVAHVLVNCTSELNFYIGLGTLVWFNSILAGCGMGLMLSETTGSSFKAMMGGIFWFLCVLNLDRFLLLVRTDNTGWKKLMPFSRILLSLCLSIIIGEHVVQFIFHNEINNQLAQDALAAQQLNYEKARGGFPEIALLLEEKRRKQAEIDRKTDEVSRLRDAYIAEAEGTAGSRIKGKGPLFEQKERDYHAAQEEQQKLEDEVKEIDGRLQAKNAELQRVADTANQAKASERGGLAFHRALFEIIRHDFTLLVLYLVITTAMILFEITPLIAKLGGKGRLHDHILEREIERRKSEEDGRHAAQLQNIKNEAQSESAFAERVSQLRLNTLNEVADSIQSGTDTQLSEDKAAVAKVIKEHVFSSIISRFAQKQGEQKTADPENDGAGLDAESSLAVSVILGGEEGQTPFTIVFRQPHEKVRGSDLVYALAGLEKQRPVGSKPRVPLHDCAAMNSEGERIKLSDLLFPQISPSNMVYLSPFEPTVSNADN
jgi:hypothetical protein